MQVILLQDIKKIGNKGDIKDVKEGYAKNFLLPNRLAISANSAKAEKIKQEKILKNSQKDEELEKLIQEAKNIKQNSKTISGKINSKGVYYAALKDSDLANLFDISNKLLKKIQWPKIDKPGDYQAKIILGKETIILNISAKPESSKK